jgi:light-independent protochlorophyllide reductase subunit B
MQLTLWSYEGPPHVGAMRIAASMKGVHLILHAPQGDTYADLLFTMIERRASRPPVSYTSFQARDLGRDTAELFKTTVEATYERFKPELILIGESCTAELIQDQPGALAQGMGLPVPVLPLELPAYTRKENWGANETFYQMVRGLLKSRVPAPGTERELRAQGARPKANLLGPTALGYRCRDDILEVTRLLDSIGIDVNLVAPLGATPADLLRIPRPTSTSVSIPRSPIRPATGCAGASVSRWSRPSRSASAPPVSSSRRPRAPPGSKSTRRASQSRLECPGTRGPSTRPI